jgi:hypothetical protein
MRRTAVSTLTLALLLAACGSSEGGASSEVRDAGGVVDAASAFDAGSPFDAGSIDSSTGPDSGAADASAPTLDASAFDAVAIDAGAFDANASDGSMVDASSPLDAATADAARGDAGPTCHTLAFGRAEVPFTRVTAAELPALTGGALEDGTYDLAKVETTENVPSSFRLRGTWRFAGNVVEQVDQVQANALGPLTLRTGSITVSGPTLSRRYTCGSSDARVVNGVSTFRVMSGGTRLTFEKRP